jgi:hypothetical protein
MNQSKNSAIAVAQLHLLRVGNHEQGFLHLRHLLAEIGNEQVLLEQARSPSDALARLKQAPCDLVLCEYRSGDGKAIRHCMTSGRLPQPRPWCFSAITLTKRP